MGTYVCACLAMFFALFHASSLSLSFASLWCIVMWKHTRYYIKEHFAYIRSPWKWATKTIYMFKQKYMKFEGNRNHFRIVYHLKCTLWSIDDSEFHAVDISSFFVVWKFCFVKTKAKVWIGVYLFFVCFLHSDERTRGNVSMEKQTLDSVNKSTNCTSCMLANCK